MTEIPVLMISNNTATVGTESNHTRLPIVRWIDKQYASTTETRADGFVVRAMGGYLIGWLDSFSISSYQDVA